MSSNVATSSGEGEPADTGQRDDAPDAGAATIPTCSLVSLSFAKGLQIRLFFAPFPGAVFTEPPTALVNGWAAGCAGDAFAPFPDV